jgi:integrase
MTKSKKTTKRNSWGNIQPKTNSKGQVRYYASYIVEGKRYQLGAYDFRANAEHELYKVKCEIEAEKWTPPKTKQEIQLEQLAFTDYAEKVLKERDVRESTRRVYRIKYQLHIKKFFTGKILNQITAEDCKKWAATLDKTQPRMLEAAIMVLKVIFNSAVNDRLMSENPAKKLKRINTRTTSSDIHGALLSESEVLALIEATPPKYRLITVLGAYCGTRIGEALALTRADVDIKTMTVSITKQVQHSNGEAIICKTKTEKSNRVVPIPPEAVDYFTEHLENECQKFPTSYLFERPSDHMPLNRVYYNDRIFDRARKSIQRPKFRYHDLRHTCLTYYARNGATIKDLMAIAGHSQAEIAMLYQETSSDRLHDLARLFNYHQHKHIKDYQQEVAK